MKIFISADIEGSIGVLDGCECRHGNEEYERARRYMTEEVAAASRGAYGAGANEVVIKDAHGTGRNIIIDDLPEEVEVIRGWSGHPFTMLQDLDATFDGVIFTGYHSGAGIGGNPLAHTISGGVVQEIRINGEKASEYLINSYTASYVGVPVIYVCGDKKLIEEVEGHKLGVKTLAVKEGSGGSVRGVSLKKGIGLIEEGVAQAVREIENIRKMEFPKEFKLELIFKSEAQAVRGGFYPGMRRSGAYEVEGVFTDYFDLLRALMFLIRG
ncbi:amino acid amidase [Propionigenium maris DSM 9537]|uniref:Amino acid amidase n=1 Tax=Propionigenium maris DSM 9537 TaxID=1123000 RepID=A0A9W6GJU9_9FUSO|nr:M55 family metallopeptidase [Propionigenium maris]GLI56484.1 amino acid amidase [Propionigenium maris DSM 9537]